MKFTELNLSVQGADKVFKPYDRGANGAFVYRSTDSNLHAPRLVITTTTNDTSNDKYILQINTPRVKTQDVGCCDPEVLLGTDLVKTELRFLATTSSALRLATIDTQIALLQEFRTTVADREKLYA